MKLVHHMFTFMTQIYNESCILINIIIALVWMNVKIKQLLKSVGVCGHFDDIF